MVLTDKTIQVVRDVSTSLRPSALNLGLDSDATGDWVSKMVDVRIKVRARRAE